MISKYTIQAGKRGHITINVIGTDSYEHDMGQCRRIIEPK